MTVKLTEKQRHEMLREYRAGKSSGLLARKYRVAESWPRALNSRRLKAEAAQQPPATSSPHTCRPSA